MSFTTSITTHERLLLSILTELGLSAARPNLVLVANKLSAIARKEPPWSYNYLSNILRGEPASKRLAWAMESLLASMDGVPASGAGKVEFTVLADPAHFQNGVVVLLPVKPCWRPVCPVRFVGWPAQKYCCLDCKKLDYKERTHEQRHPHQAR